MKKQIIEVLEHVLEGMGLEEKVSPEISVPENPAHGDYTTNIALKTKNPRKFAEDLKNAIIQYQKQSDAGIVERVEIAGPGFINLFLSEAAISTEVAKALKKQDAYGAVPNGTVFEGKSIPARPHTQAKRQGKTAGSQPGKNDRASGEKNTQFYSRKNAAIASSARQDKKISEEEGSELISAKRITIEFAQPNPFKEIHIGHLRNISLGESYCRLSEAAGNVVRRVNYEGDVGMHVAKAIWGKLHGASWDTAYAAGSKVFESDDTAKIEIGKLNKRIYDNDPELKSLYQEGRQWSLDRFEGIYARLGTHFDRYYFESEVAPLGIQIVHDHPSVFELSDGAMIYRGEKVGLHTRVFVTKEQYATYEAKDLALAPLKYKEWPYDLSIIMTGNEQSEYFKVMLAALFEINPDLAAKTRHMPFGMIRLTTGKMSSRTGDVITAEWLLKEAKKRIKKILDKSDSNYSVTIQNDIAEKAAVAAVKYSMLKVNASSDISFDIEASVSFDGDSGPYLQYTYARARSVLRKIAHFAGFSDMPIEINTEERLLERQIIQFPDVVEEAAQNFSPNIICTYLFHLAQQFNLLYAKHQIIGNPKREQLTAATAQVIKNGLYVLGIDVLEQM